jgi:hypothetical protein
MKNEKMLYKYTVGVWHVDLFPVYLQRAPLAPTSKELLKYKLIDKQNNMTKCHNKRMKGN